MEIFSQLMDEAASGFDFHYGCAEIGLSHICSADDLLVFVVGNLKSVQCIKEVMESFSDLSGLIPNPEKSSLFLSGIPDGVKTQIKECLYMEEGKLHVRYLGVPLISKKLSAVNLEFEWKIAGRVTSWVSKHLSFAGRLQLIKSVLIGMQVY